MDECTRVEDIVFRRIVSPLSSDDINRLYPYPARFIQHVPRYAIDYYIRKNGRLPGRVFDPFAGSGTTAVEASLYCISSIVWDLSPLIKVFVRGKTAIVDDNMLAKIKTLIDKALEYKGEFYPDFPTLEEWYDERILKVVSRMWGFYHDNIGYYDRVKREFMPKVDDNIWALTSLILLKTSRKLSLTDDSIPKLYKSKIKKAYIQKLLNRKESIREIVAKKLNFYYKKITKAAREYTTLLKSRCSTKPRILIKGFVNVLEENKWPNNIDLVITSPPYLAAHEYVRSIKLELYWLGVPDSDVRKLRQIEIPYNTSTPNIKIESETYKEYKALLKRKFLKIYETYFKSIIYSLEQAFNTINKKGYMFVLVGSATLNGIQIPIHKIICEHFTNNNGTIEKILRDPIRRRRIAFKRKNKNPNGIEGEYLVIINKNK